MTTTLLVHDLPAERVAPLAERYTVFGPSAQVRPCVGCFGCWVKTPGQCVIRDHESELALLLPQCAEWVIMSRVVFGGLSLRVKGALDRSIGYMLPFFRDVGGETHHAPRYAHRPRLRYLLYGELTEGEQETARELVKANEINFGAVQCTVEFFASAEQALEELK